jgi:hypothetical protein
LWTPHREKRSIPPQNDRVPAKAQQVVSSAVLGWPPPPFGHGFTDAAHGRRHAPLDPSYMYLI